MLVFQTTSDHLCLFRLKFGACYSMLQYKSVERIHSKEYCFMFSCTLLVFLLVFIIKLLFYHFIFLFDEVSNFRQRILTNQKQKLVIVK